MSEGGNTSAGDDYLTSKPFLDAKAYITSKGLPLTAENVRRYAAMQQANPTQAQPTSLAYTPGAPPDAQGGAAPTSNARGSAAGGLAQRMHQTTPQAQPTPQQPNAASDSAMGAPTAQPAAGGGGNMLSSIAQMILGGGAGAGLAHLFMGGGSAPPTSAPPIPNIPVPGGGPQLSAPSPSAPPTPMPQLSAPEPQIMPPAQIGGPAVMPRGAAPATNVASGAPVSIVPREPGPGNLGGMDWAKILSDVSHVAGRR